MGEEEEYMYIIELALLSTMAHKIDGLIDEL